QRDPAALAPREAHSPFDDQRLVTVREAHNEIMHVGEFGGSNNLLLARPRPGIFHILGNVGGEQYRVLEHDRKLVPKIVELVLTNVDPIQEDLAGGDVVNRGRRLTSVLLPAPVWPAIPTRAPAETSSQRS